MSSMDPPLLSQEQRSISIEVVSRVADLKGCDPVDLSPLHEILDPDALDALFRPLQDGTSRVGEGFVRFEYEGYRVTVTGDGEIDAVETRP